MLRSLSAHPRGISHDSLSQVASGSAEVVVRAFLVEHGVLAWRDENLARLEAWWLYESEHLTHLASEAELETFHPQFLYTCFALATIANRYADYRAEKEL